MSPHPWIKPVLCVEPSMTVRLVARRMTAEHVGSVVVQSGDTIVGIATDRDIALTVFADELDPNSATIAECMSAPVITLGTDESPDVASRRMRKHRLRRLPVVDPSGAVVGIVSADDLIAELGQRWQALARAVTRGRASEEPDDRPKPRYGTE